MIDRSKVIAQGVAAKSLLENQTFTSVINELADTFTSQLLMTAPSEKDRREEFYNQHLALQAIVGVLQYRSSQADALITETDEEEEDL